MTLTDRWLDLDADTPPATRSPVRWARTIAAAVLTVAAATGGACLALAARSGPPQPATSVVATVRLAGVVLAPVPSVLLEVRVENLAPPVQRVTEIHVRGGGARETTLPVRRPVDGGEPLTAGITAPLDCTGSAATGRATVAVRLADSSEPVVASGTGRAGQLGGLCATADAALPGGWRQPARAASWSLTGGLLDLTVTGLAPDARRVLWVEADGVLLPQSLTPPEVRDGAAHLRLRAPTPGCADGGVRPVVPTGLELHVDTSGGIRPAYVRIGAALSGWLMDAYVAACPTRPGGPAIARGTGA